MRIVAVDGPSAAGKSTFAARLSATLGGAPVVGADDFPVPWDGDPLAWWPPFAAQVLGPLSEGRPARFRRYDWRRGVYGEETEIPAAPVLVVEGVGAARRRRPAAFRVWVDAPHDVRRRRARSAATTWRPGTAGPRSEARHFAADRTRERADLIVDVTRPFRACPVDLPPGCAALASTARRSAPDTPLPVDVRAGCGPPASSA